MKKEVLINSSYITLGQLLKEESVVNSGGEAKWYLKDHQTLLNGDSENRRGKKLYDGDILEVPDIKSTYFIKNKTTKKR